MNRPNQSPELALSKCQFLAVEGAEVRSQWQTKRRRVPNVGWIFVTQIAQTDGQDIYDTAPAFGVIVMVMVMAPAHGTPPKLRQTNGKLMADTLGETFACLTWHTMATPIANPNENPNPNPNSNLYSIESHGLHSKKKNQKTGQVNKRGTENCSRCTCITYI